MPLILVAGVPKLSTLSAMFFVFATRDPMQAPFNQNKDLPTKVSLTFVKILDEFPREHELHMIFNCTTVKISYIYMTNLKQNINRHNKSVLHKKPCCLKHATAENQPSVPWIEIASRNLLFIKGPSQQKTTTIPKPMWT